MRDRSVQGVHEALLAQTAKEVAQHLDTLKIEALTGRGLQQAQIDTEPAAERGLQFVRRRVFMM